MVVLIPSTIRNVTLEQWLLTKVTVLDKPNKYNERIFQIPTSCHYKPHVSNFKLINNLSSHLLTIVNLDMSYLTRLHLLKEKILEFYDKKDDHDDNKISDDNDESSSSSSSSSITQFYNHILLIYKNITYNYDICMELEISFREILKNTIMMTNQTELLLKH